MAAREAENSEDDDLEMQDEITFVMDENEQDENVRRDIRRKYRDLNQETQAKMEVLAETGPDEVKNLIERTDVLFGQVTKTREAALDSQQMHLCAEILKRNAESWSASLSEFKPFEFAEKLVSHLGNRIEDDDDDASTSDLIQSASWIDFGKEVLPMFKKAPSFHFMYGSFEVNEVHPERKRRAARAKDDEAAKAVVPKQVAEIKKSEQETTTEEVQRVLAILTYLYEKNDQDPFCYFQFVTDPKSFGHTVENIFHVSFLVKDGLAGIALDEHGLPVIFPTDEKQQEETTSQEANQFVMTLTMDDWQEIVDTFNITTPCIPPRSK